jgi:hypothetical protein
MLAIPENIPSRFEVKKYLTHLALEQCVALFNTEPGLSSGNGFFRRMWNKGNRKLSVLDWGAIIA